MNIKELCETLKESTYYGITLSIRPGNPVHNAILYTGFKNGAYRDIWNATYDGSIKDCFDTCIITSYKEIFQGN